MAIPDFQTIMFPFLELSSDEKVHNFAEAVVHWLRNSNLLIRR